MNPVFVGAAYWDKANTGAATAGLFRLRPEDGGWERLAKDLPDKVEVRAIAVSRSDANVLIAGTQVGPYRTRDGGDTWERLPLPDDDAVIWSIAIHPEDEKTIYAGAVDNVIYRTHDAGATWERLPTPRPSGQVRMGFPTRVVRIAIDPTNTSRIYAGLEVNGVVRSDDGGDTWSDCNESLLRFAERDEYKSRIGSDTDVEGMMDSHAVLVSPTTPDKVYLANRLGLFTSEDAGQTWADLVVGRYSPITYARDVQVSSHDTNRFFGALSVAAASDEGALYQSHDAGQSWSRFDHGVTIDSTLMSVSTSYRTPDRVYAAARRGKVIGTEDGGKSWTEYTLPGNVQGVYAVASP